MAIPNRSPANRRQVLTIVLGGVALATLADRQAEAGQVSKASVRYQDGPKGNQNCANCKLFEAPSACKNVAGPVSPQGWCAIWIKA